jgi:hypothetical protein
VTFRFTSKRPSVAALVAVVALVVATTGTSYAAIQLEKNSIRTKHLRNGAVTGAKARDHTITGRDLRDGSVTSRDLAPGVLPSPHILRASKDVSPLSISLTNSRAVRVNEVTIAVPSNGVLRINGRISIDNDEPAAQEYMLVASFNHRLTSTLTWNARALLERNAAPGQGADLNYTTTIPVTVGQYELHQAAGPIDATSRDWTYNAEEFTVEFIPDAHVDHVGEPGPIGPE